MSALALYAEYAMGGAILLGLTVASVGIAAALIAAGMAMLRMAVESIRAIR